MTMASIVTEDASAPGVDSAVTRPHAWIDVPAVPEARVPGDGLPTAWSTGDFEDLDDPTLVLSEGYIGTDRRSQGLWSRLRRGTFPTRRSLLRLEAVVVALIVVVVVGALVLVRPEPATSGATSGTQRPTTGAGGAAAATASTEPAPVVTPPAAAPVPSTTTPVTVTPPAAAPPTVTTPLAPLASTTPLTPEQLGAQALALVRYPWQAIPGYTIQFEPISAAPSPGFYGNTTFTWGQTGGTSVLYVYPGETVQRLAGITAFEIAHEVDAAAVQPQGGEAQIENELGLHPASWAPNCDCAEQGFLSGWYAAAFSNYWSPGVGNWSPLAPMPTGATLTAVEPWLNPTIP